MIKLIIFPMIVAEKIIKSVVNLTSIRKIISILRQVFEYTVLYGDIKINPACQIPLPKRINKKEERQVFLTTEDAQKMIKAFKNEEIRPIVYVTLYYGFRKTEVLGLRSQVVDFYNNTISINHTVVVMVIKSHIKEKIIKFFYIE